MAEKSILSENKAYWTGRASGYSEVNQAELETQQRQKWSDCLHGEIARQFPGIAAARLRVLEVGTGPGFFAILLCELGYDVTAIDLTPAMLEDIARRVPLSSIRRSAWDLTQLRGLGLHALADEQIWRRVWSDEEKLNFSSTPLFMIRGIKE